MRLLDCRHGCYVQGLYLEGAAWDHEQGQLMKQAPRQVVDELPLLQVSMVKDVIDALQYSLFGG